MFISVTINDQTSIKTKINELLFENRIKLFYFIFVIAIL